MSASIIIQDASNTTIIEQGPSATTSASDLTSGTLALARGGTGVSLTDLTPGIQFNTLNAAKAELDAIKAELDAAPGSIDVAAAVVRIEKALQSA